jgi:regulator of sigma E protease
MDLIIFLMALSILVLAHEVGHYLAATKAGVKVEEFGLGLPPRVVSKKIKGTIWSLNWLPIGGFCKLYGEEDGGKGEEAFNNQKPASKAVIVLAGVVMNLLLAVVIFSVVYQIVGVPLETERVKVIGVAADSPAQEAGLKEGDWIKEVENKRISQPQELTVEVEKFKGGKVILWVESQGKERMVAVEVREKAPEGQGAMGVVISNIEMKAVRWYQFYLGVAAGFKEAYYWSRVIVGGLNKTLTALLMGRIPGDVAGPIGMYQASSNIKKAGGLLAVAHFFGIVSVNLAIVNVLPFPALDGGRIIFVIYELVSKKRPNKKLELIVNNLGMAILLSLLVVISAADVMRLIK